MSSSSQGRPSDDENGGGYTGVHWGTRILHAHGLQCGHLLFQQMVSMLWSKFYLDALPAIFFSPWSLEMLSTVIVKLLSNVVVNLTAS